MKMKDLTFIFLILLSSSSAMAQSTATPVTPMILTTTGCPGSQLSCAVPISPTNPLPTTTTGN